MISKGYDGAKVEPKALGGTIRVTKEWVAANVKASQEDQDYLQSHVVGWSVCPATFTLHDTPDVRRILGIGGESPDDWQELIND